MQLHIKLVLQMAEFTFEVSCLSNYKLMSAYADLADDAWSAMYVYLLHFNKPINPNRPTQHYLGFTKDLDERILQHRQGKGAKQNPSCFGAENLLQSCLCLGRRSRQFSIRGTAHKHWFAVRSKFQRISGICRL